MIANNVISIKYSTGKPASAIFNFTTLSTECEDAKMFFRLSPEEYRTRVFGNLIQISKSEHEFRKYKSYKTFDKRPKFGYILEDVNLQRYDLNIDKFKYDAKSLYRKDNELSKRNEYLFIHRKDNELSKYNKYLFVNRKDNKLYKNIGRVPTYRKDNELSKLNEYILLEMDQQSSNVTYTDTILSKLDNITNVYNSYKTFDSTENNTNNCNTSSLVFEDDGNTLIDNTNVGIRRYTEKDDTNKDFIGINIELTERNINNNLIGFSISRDDLVPYINSFNRFVVGGELYCDMFEDYKSLGFGDKYLREFKGFVNAFSDTKDVFINHNVGDLLKDDPRINTENYLKVFDINSKESSLYTQSFLGKENALVEYLWTPKTFDILGENLEMTKDSISGKVDESHLNIIYSSKTIDYEGNFGKMNNDLFADVSSDSAFIFDTNKSASKNKSTTTINSYLNGVQKGGMYARVFESLTAKNPDMRSSIVNEPIFLNRGMTNTQVYENYNWVKRDNTSMLINNSSDLVNKIETNAFLYESNKWVNVGWLYAHINNFEDFMVDGNKEVATNNDPKWIGAIYKRSVIDDCSKSLSNNPKYVSVNIGEMLLDSYGKGVHKNLGENTLSISGKNVNTYNTLKTLKSKWKDLIKYDLYVSLLKYDTGLDITNDYKSLYKEESSILYNNSYKWFNLEGKGVGIFSNESMDDNSHKVRIENDILFGCNWDKDTDKELLSNINVRKKFKSFSTQDVLMAKGKEKDIHTDNSNNFVYVKDFLPPIEILKGALDELLLPREEYDYSKIKNKVFGDNLSINPRYLKGFSEEGNPIINVPIENPIKYYTDIAKDYIDVDVRVMRKVIELLYRNWRENIQRFAGLDATKAMNFILERTHNDLKEWYVSVTDKDRIYHAERSLKLFAWYSEMGILTHSSKEVIYEVANGVFGFWGELPTYSTSSNNKVQAILDEEIEELVEFNYSNSNPYILSSTKGQDATLKIKNLANNKETRLKFKAYIKGTGALTVTVGENIFTYNGKMNSIDLILPSEDNSFTINFLPETEDSYVDIASFVIEGRYNVSYKIDYTGVVSNVNFTIQHILDFMTCAGDSIEEVQPVFKTTAQLAYTLEQFKVYMETHHDNMYKGKRLTIKKS